MTSLDTTIRLLVPDMFRKSWGRWSFPQCYQNHSCDTSIFMICHIMSGNGYKKVQRPFGIDLVTPDMFRTPWRKWPIPQCCINRSCDISNFMICGNNNENKCSGHPWPFWTGLHRTYSGYLEGNGHFLSFFQNNSSFDSSTTIQDSWPHQICSVRPGGKGQFHNTVHATYQI